MKLLSIFDTLYQSRFFTTFLLVTIILLTVLFGLLFFIGIRDAKKDRKANTSAQEKKSNDPVLLVNNKKEKKEDVTFEESFLTQNLENFKKTLEEEIKKEDKVFELKPDEKDYVEILKEKKVPILDKEAIDDTVMSPILIDDETDLEIPKSKKNA